MNANEIRAALSAAQAAAAKASAGLSTRLERRTLTSRELSAIVVLLRRASLSAASCLEAIDPQAYDHLTREGGNREYWRELCALGKADRLPEKTWPRNGS